MPYCLLPLDGGLPVVLDGPRLTLGRHPGCDRVICHDTVSRRHCRIAQRGHYLAIRDLSSSNGVRVNGRRIQEDTSIAPGDRLRLGSAEFVLAMQSEEVLALVSARAARATEPAALDDLSMTQPLALLLDHELEQEEPPQKEPTQDGSAQEGTKQKGLLQQGPPQEQLKQGDVLPDLKELPEDDVRPQPQPLPEAERPLNPVESEPTADDAGDVPREEFTDQSWDMIVALSQRGETVPDPEREPPSAEIRVMLEDTDEDRLENRAVALGYAARPPAGANWNHVRIGLSLMRWGGLAAALALMLLWVVPTVSVFTMSVRIATSVFSPFETTINASPGDAASYGTLALLALVTPIVVCVVFRNVSEDGFWPAVAVSVLGVLIGQLVRFDDTTMLQWLAGACGLGIAVGLFVLLVGQGLACYLPKRIPLAARGAGGVALLVLTSIITPVLFVGAAESIPSLSLPIGRPDFGILVYIAMITAAAGVELILLYLGAIGRQLREAPLCESIDFCLGWTVVSTLLALGVWFVVAGDHVARGWSDLLLLAATAGVTISLAWTAQLAGHVRFALR